LYEGRFLPFRISQRKEVDISSFFAWSISLFAFMAVGIANYLSQVKNNFAFRELIFIDLFALSE